MKKYKVVDLYDGKDVLGYADTKQEIKRLANERIDDTDGECDIYVLTLDPEVNKYRIKSLKSYKEII